MCHTAGPSAWYPTTPPPAQTAYLRDAPACSLTRARRFGQSSSAGSPESKAARSCSGLRCFGVLLVHATGAGAASRQAIGTAVFYGMIGSTLLGLIFTPVPYVVSTAVAERIRKPKKLAAADVVVALPSPVLSVAT